MNTRGTLPENITDADDVRSVRTQRPPQRLSLGLPSAPAISTAKLRHVVQDMDQIIRELEKTVSELSEEALSKKRRSTASQVKSRKEKEKDKKEEGIFGMFHRRSAFHNSFLTLRNSKNYPLSLKS